MQQCWHTGRLVLARPTPWGLQQAPRTLATGQTGRQSFPRPASLCWSMWQVPRASTTSPLRYARPQSSKYHTAGQGPHHSSNTHCWIPSSLPCSYTSSRWLRAVCDTCCGLPAEDYWHCQPCWSADLAACTPAIEIVGGWGQPCASTVFAQCVDAESAKTLR